MKANNKLKKILTIIGIPLVGFILLNITFLFAALFHTIFNRLFSGHYEIISRWIPASRHILFAIVIILISWFILKSKKIKELYQATYAVVPTATILVTIGIFLYQRPLAVYSLSVLFFGAIIYYLYRKKKPWFYYYSVTWVTLALLIMGILGIDI